MNNETMWILIFLWGICGISGFAILGAKMRFQNFLVLLLLLIIFTYLGPISIFLAQNYKKTPTITSNILTTKNMSSNAFSVIGIFETHRNEEQLGDEIREIDNSKSDIQVSRKFTVSKEWTSSYTVEYKKAIYSTGDFSINLATLANLKTIIEKHITEKYSVTTSVKRSYVEEITLTIPAKKRVFVNLHWKQLWQCGVVRLQDKNNAEVEIPFKICLEPTFDQQHIDYATQR